MAGIHISNHVAVRDGMGRFIADIEAAAPKLIQASLDAGEEVAQGVAPEDTGRLRGSFVTKLVSRTMGYLGNTAPYAKWQDQGGDPHKQRANVSFFWEEQGRMWRPGKTPPQMINHPGNPATHFMKAGYEAACRFAAANMDRFYPG